MRRALTVLLLVMAVLTLTAPIASAGHKPGHRYPPGCQKEPGSNSPGCKKHFESSSFTRPLERPSEDPAGITIGMVTLGGLVAGTAALVVLRHRRFRTLTD